MSDKPRVLLIEDEQFWQSVLKEELENEGLDVTLLADYGDARQALAERTFDLIILDLELDKSTPILDGERLLRRLTQRHGSTPCIIVSGQGDVQIVRNAFKKYHVVDFVGKEQFDILSFVKTVREALGPGQRAAQGVEAALPALPLTKGSADRSEQARLVKLLQILTQRFDESELRTLCFHLGVDYEDLRDVGKSNKARELIRYLHHRNRLPELVRAGKRMRPDIAWEDSSS